MIAFPFNEPESQTMEGEVYVCTEVAKQQAREYQVSYRNELLRLIIHGVLHLVGYDDQDDENRMKMRETENNYLSQCLQNKQ